MRTAILFLAFALLPVHATGQTPSDSLRPFLPLGSAISTAFGSARSSLAGVGQAPQQDDEGVRVSVRLFGGATYLAGGDINDGVIGFNELQTLVLMNDRDEEIKSGKVEPVHWGFEYGGDVIIHFTSRFGIGVGVSRLEASQASEIVASNPRFSSFETKIFNTLEVRAVPIRLGVFYTLPASNRLNIILNGGVGFYPTDFLWNWRFDNVTAGSVTRATDVDTQASGTGVGYHGGVVVEFALVERVGVFFEGQGTYAKVGGLDGSAEGTYSYRSPTTEDGTIYYGELEGGPTTGLDSTLPVISLANKLPRLMDSPVPTLVH